MAHLFHLMLAGVDTSHVAQSSVEPHSIVALTGQVQVLKLQNLVTWQEQIKTSINLSPSPPFPFLISSPFDAP